MESFSILHKANIIIHVSGGSLALIIGLTALMTKKGAKLHKYIGKVFLILLAVVIITGLIGVFVFGRNTFLLVITVLSGYLGYSGYRTLKKKSSQLEIIDIGMATFSLLCVAYFLFYFKSIGMIWNPIIIYSTVGYLILVTGYDLLKGLIPADKYKNLWLYEHILKMVSALSGLFSAFSGTVFPQYQPYSQFLPSVLGTMVALGFMYSTFKRAKNKTTNPIDQL
ncbi:DUF2306 domain-containing protein [Pedobacter nototheniae]|uniref:hypothetical protein n=1 Tax=Pedobacter nototheniae TaxID=2488994 RepID=UPI00103D2453|nr:hypothetical protein [Pedobacter nototheniae]